jgi:hypothetical protein
MIYGLKLSLFGCKLPIFDLISGKKPVRKNRNQKEKREKKNLTHSLAWTRFTRAVTMTNSLVYRVRYTPFNLVFLDLKSSA